MRKSTRKVVSAITAAAMVLSLAACGGKSEDTPAADTPAETTEGGSEQAEQETPAAGETIELSLWTSNELHNQMFQFGEKAYNEKHPDNPVKLNIETYPNT